MPQSAPASHGSSSFVVGFISPCNRTWIPNRSSNSNTYPLPFPAAFPYLVAQPWIRKAPKGWMQIWLCNSNRSGFVTLTALAS